MYQRNRVSQLALIEGTSGRTCSLCVGGCRVCVRVSVCRVSVGWIVFWGGGGVACDPAYAAGSVPPSLTQHTHTHTRTRTQPHTHLADASSFAA